MFPCQNVIPTWMEFITNWEKALYAEEWKEPNVGKVILGNVEVYYAFKAWLAGGCHRYPWKADKTDKHTDVFCKWMYLRVRNCNWRAVPHSSVKCAGDVGLDIVCLLCMFAICLKPLSEVWSVVLLPLTPRRANKENPAALVSSKPVLLSVVVGPLMAMPVIVGNSLLSWAVPLFGKLTVPSKFSLLMMSSSVL